MPNWDEVKTDPRYVDASPENKQKMRLNFFKKYINPTPEYKAMSEEERGHFNNKFLMHPETQAPVEKPSIGEMASDYLGTVKKIVQAPFTAVKSSAVKGAKDPEAIIKNMKSAEAGVIEGMSLGLVKTGEPTSTAKSVGEFAGTFLPMNTAFKVAQNFLSTAKFATRTQKVFSEGALGGILYSVAKGRIEGKSDLEILQEAGAEGLTWGAFGGVLNKFTEYLGTAVAKKQMRGVVDSLTKEIEGLSKKDAEKVVIEAMKALPQGEIPKALPRGAIVLRPPQGAVKELPSSGKVTPLPATIEKPIDSMAKEGVKLYSGLPVDKISDLIKAGRARLGTVNRSTLDLGPITAAIHGLHSPTYLSKVHPAAEKLVTLSQETFLATEKRFTNIFLRARDEAVKGLNKEEKYQVALLLDKFDTVGDIPVETLSRIPKEVIRSFTQLRNRVYNPIFRIAGANDGEKPKRIQGYLTHLFKDTEGMPVKQREEVIKSFAEQNGLDYLTASNILRKGFSQEGFFGPLSKSRTGSKRERIWDLDFLTDFYIKGAARKVRLDTFLPDASTYLKELPEGSKIWKVMRDYIDVQRGMPVTMLDRALNGTAFAKVAKYEGLRQYVSKLGLNVAATAINLTQYPVFDGAKFIGAALRHKDPGYIKDFAKGFVAVATKRGRMLAHRSGVMFDVGKGEIPVGDIRSSFDKVAKVTGFAFELSERYNKTASYTANYSAMMRLIEKSGVKMSGREKYEAARTAGIKGVAQTQFFLGKEDRPLWLMNPLGSTLGRFKTFPIKSLEFIANMDKYEATAFLGILTTMGGPTLIPFVKDLSYHLNENHPDSDVTKVLNGLQKNNLLAYFNQATGADIDLSERLSPLQSPIGINTRSWEDFWTEVADSAIGPTGSDIRNLYSDLRSGTIDLESPDWQDILGSRSATSISVQVQRTARALKETESKYVEYSRGRKGPELNDTDVWMRGLGFTTTNVEHQREEMRRFSERVQKAQESKQRIEDKIVKLSKKMSVTTDAKEREKLSASFGLVIKEMSDFNHEQATTTGVLVTPQTVRSAMENTMLPIEQRVGRNKVQKSILMNKLKGEIE